MFHCIPLDHSSIGFRSYLPNLRYKFPLRRDQPVVPVFKRLSRFLSFIHLTFAPYSTSSTKTLVFRFIPHCPGYLFVGSGSLISEISPVTRIRPFFSSCHFLTYASLMRATSLFEDGFSTKPTILTMRSAGAERPVGWLTMATKAWSPQILL